MITTRWIWNAGQFCPAKPTVNDLCNADLFGPELSFAPGDWLVVCAVLRRGTVLSPIDFQFPNTSGHMAMTISHGEIASTGNQRDQGSWVAQQLVA